MHTITKQNELMDEIRDLKTLEAMIRFHGSHYGEKPAITFNGITMTYAEIQRRANQVAHGIITENGYGRSRVATVLKNSK